MRSGSPVEATCTWMHAGLLPLRFPCPEEWIAVVELPPRPLAGMENALGDYWKVPRHVWATDGLSPDMCSS